MNTMTIEGQPVSLKGFTEALESMKVGEKILIKPIGKGWDLVVEKVAMTAEENPWEVPAEGWIFVGKGGSLWDDDGEGFVWAEYKSLPQDNAVYIKPRYAYFSIKRWWKQGE